VPWVAASRPSRLLLAVALGLAMVLTLLVLGGPRASGAASASSLSARHCGTIPTKDEFHPRVRVYAERISCSKARRIMRAYLDGPESEKELVGPDDYNGYIRLKRFPGWRCTSGAGSGGCSKGRATTIWGWTT
jgi:hypothetical protein